jgi:hypothetical protein
MPAFIGFACLPTLRPGLILHQDQADERRNTLNFFRLPAIPMRTVGSFLRPPTFLPFLDKLVVEVRKDPDAE